MTVQELIGELQLCEPDQVVYVMGDNGCRDPGMGEAIRVSSHYDKWEKKDIVYIYSDEY